MASTDPGPSTALEVVKPGSFLVLNHSTTEIADAIGFNLGGADASEFDLVRATLPAGGGGSRFKVETPFGTQDPDELSGVIVHVRNTRAYWRDEFDGGSTPPDCSSPDTKWGYGNPGDGLRAMAPPKGCPDCPMSKFGSADDGRGQACKQMQQWFLLTPDSFLPLVVTLPPTSLKGGRKYLMGLAGAGLRYDQVVTSLRVGSVATGARANVACVKPEPTGKLDADEATRVREYAEALSGVFASAAITGDSGEPAAAPPADQGAERNEAA